LAKIYGQIIENPLSVRKMCFSYGQIIKNEAFVRKFE